MDALVTGAEKAAQKAGHEDAFDDNVGQVMDAGQALMQEAMADIDLEAIRKPVRKPAAEDAVTDLDKSKTYLFEFVGANDTLQKAVM